MRHIKIMEIRYLTFQTRKFKKNIRIEKILRENLIINSNKYVLEKIMNKKYSKGFNQVKNKFKKMLEKRSIYSN